mgnify:CR=1 FL=1
MKNLKIAARIIATNHRCDNAIKSLEKLESIMNIYEMNCGLTNESIKLYNVGKNLKEIGKNLKIERLYFIAADFYLLAAKFLNIIYLE